MSRRKVVRGEVKQETGKRRTRNRGCACSSIDVGRWLQPKSPGLCVCVRTCVCPECAGVVNERVKLHP